MKKDPIPFLKHILQSCEYIEEYIDGVSREDFLSSTQLQDSVIRRLEIIGEATKNLDAEIKAAYPRVPWKRMAGMRDTLIHGYFGVDLKSTWKVASDDVPELKRNVDNILRSMEDR